MPCATASAVTLSGPGQPKRTRRCRRHEGRIRQRRQLDQPATVSSFEGRFAYITYSVFRLAARPHKPLREVSAVGVRAGERKTCWAKPLAPQTWVGTERWEASIEPCDKAKLMQPARVWHGF
jgi:hypothetical protein